MADKKNYTLTIAKDGQFYPVNALGTVVHEGGSSTKDKTKRAPVLMPYFPIASDTKTLVGGNSHYVFGYYGWSGSLDMTVNEFLQTPLLQSSYPFDFENHNYYWAYGNGKCRSSDYLWRQTCGSDINPADLKKCRKKYSNELHEIPTWTSLLTELFGSSIFEQLDTTGIVSIDRKINIAWNAPDARKKGDKWGAHGPTVWKDRQLRIQIPVRPGEDIVSIFQDSNLAIQSSKRNEPPENLQNISGRGSLYLVKDVTHFTRPGGVEQYIPGDIVFRFALCRVAYSHKAQFDTLSIVISCESLPRFYYPFGYSYDKRTNFRLSTLSKYYKNYGQWTK